MTTPVPTGSSIPTAFTDDAGNAYANRSLEVTGPNGYTGTVTTAGDGTFRIENVPVGDYTVRDPVTGSTGIAPVVLSHENARLAASVAAVDHGTTATTPRPPGVHSVVWTGSVKPDAYRAETDLLAGPIGDQSDGGTGGGITIPPGSKAVFVVTADAAGVYPTLTRPPGVVWEFQGPANPGALMNVDGDSWIQTAS